MPRFGSTCMMLESYMTYDAHACCFDFLVLFPMFMVFILPRVLFTGLRRHRGVQRRKDRRDETIFAWLSWFYFSGFYISCDGLSCIHLTVFIVWIYHWFRIAPKSFKFLLILHMNIIESFVKFHEKCFCLVSSFSPLCLVCSAPLIFDGIVNGYCFFTKPLSSDFFYLEEDSLLVCHSLLASQCIEMTFCFIETDQTTSNNVKQCQTTNLGDHCDSRLCQKQTQCIVTFRMFINVFNRSSFTHKGWLRTICFVLTCFLCQTMCSLGGQQRFWHI